MLIYTGLVCCPVEQGHVELILGEPHPLFIPDPVLCQLDRICCRNVFVLALCPIVFILKD